LIHVSNISASANEKTVKDFFLFCGKIKDFELVKADDSDKQVALVLFERESAAKTAAMLTNAMIVDSQIVVKQYFDGAPSAEDAAASAGEASGQEAKSRARILAELLAAGYQLQDQVIAKGLELDAKYGVSAYAQQYYEQVKGNLQQLDEKYKVTEQVTQRAVDIDSKYHIQERAKTYVDSALQSAPGQRVQGIVQDLTTQIAGVHAEAKKILESKATEATAAPSS